MGEVPAMKAFPPELRSEPSRFARPVIRLAVLLLTMVLGLTSSTIPAAGISTAASAHATRDYDVISEASLKPGMAIPDPTGPVILTVSGRIKSGKPVQFDLATLESIGLIRFTTMTSWTTEPAAF